MMAFTSVENANLVARRVRREGGNARQVRFAVRIIRLNGEERLGNIHAHGASDAGRHTVSLHDAVGHDGVHIGGKR